MHEHCFLPRKQWAHGNLFALKGRRSRWAHTQRCETYTNRSIISHIDPYAKMDTLERCCAWASGSENGISHEEPNAAKPAKRFRRGRMFGWWNTAPLLLDIILYNGEGTKQRFLLLRPRFRRYNRSAKVALSLIASRAEVGACCKVSPLIHKTISLRWNERKKKKTAERSRCNYLDKQMKVEETSAAAAAVFEVWSLSNNEKRGRKKCSSHSRLTAFETQIWNGSKEKLKIWTRPWPSSLYPCVLCGNQRLHWLIYSAAVSKRSRPKANCRFCDQTFTRHLWLAATTHTDFDL